MERDINKNIELHHAGLLLNITLMDYFMEKNKIIMGQYKAILLSCSVNSTIVHSHNHFILYIIIMSQGKMFLIAILYVSFIYLFIFFI